MLDAENPADNTEATTESPEGLETPQPEPAKKAAKKAPAKKAAAKKTAAKKAPAKKATTKKTAVAPADEILPGTAPEELAPAEAQAESPAGAETGESAPAAKKSAKKAAVKKASAKKAAAKKTAAKKTAPEPAEAEVAPVEVAAEETAAAPAAKAAAVAVPLFQPPAATKAAPRRKKAEPKPAEAEAAEGTEPEVEEKAAPAARAGAKKTAAKRTTAKKAAPKNEQDEPDATGASAAESEAEAEETDEDSEDQAGGNRRRRRRGGRRRRKSGEGSDGDNQQDSDESGDTQPADQADQDDRDENGGGESSSSRRRRRRRRSGDDGDGGSEDPENTVTRVRKARTAEDEITALHGSTRLEAKKQRRREGREAGRRRAPIVSEAEFLARREAVDRVMVIRQNMDLTQIAVLEDKVLVEHYVARESQTSLIGNVYLGRVQNVLPSMEAAFIDIGKGRNAVLYAGEVNWDALGAGNGPRKIEQVLKSGQAVLVQVSKDPIGHKGARLTSQISLPGRFLVYVPDGTTSGISRKLPDTERTRLKNLLKEIVPDTAGVIVRTAAEGASEDELTLDVERLTARWADIESKVEKGNAPQLLYGEPDLTLKVVRDLFTEDFGRLVVSGDDAWDMVENYVG
ncbi:MAG: ribonuclease E/G, partial [Nocardioides sp.]